MKIEDIIKILENKILYLQQQKIILSNTGDFEKLLSIDQEIDEILFIIQKLKS